MKVRTVFVSLVALATTSALAACSAPSDNNSSSEQQGRVRDLGL